MFRSAKSRYCFVLQDLMVLNRTARLWTKHQRDLGDFWMKSEKILHDFWMKSVWVCYGCDRPLPEWVLNEFRINSERILCGFRMSSEWVLNGFCMSSRWDLNELWMSSNWVLNEFWMNHERGSLFLIVILNPNADSPNSIFSPSAWLSTAVTRLGDLSGRCRCRQRQLEIQFDILARELCLEFFNYVWSQVRHI